MGGFRVWGYSYCLLLVFKGVDFFLFVGLEVRLVFFGVG